MSNLQPSSESSAAPNLESIARDRITRRLREFRALQARGALCTEVTEQLAQDAAATFLQHFEAHGEYLRDAITLLAEIATLEEPCLAEPGQRATFPLLIEALSDSFDPRHCAVYDRAFSQMISYCRQLPAARDLDDALRRFGLYSEASLLERKARLRERPPRPDTATQTKIRKVLVLSRVTLGADVAITSVVLQQAGRIFPQAERVLLGSPKLRELFGGDPALHLRELRYETAGTLLRRLRNWLPLIEVVEEEIRGLKSDEYLLIDPDSRLLQLGLLPALHDESRYFFLESRAYGALGEGSLSQITQQWLKRLFGNNDKVSPAREEALWPAVWLREQDKALGRKICGRLRRSGSRHIVAVSFGVGGNDRKRLPDAFEELLLQALVEEGCTVVLDKGLGPEEAERSERLAERLREKKWCVAEFGEAQQPGNFGALCGGCALVTWQGGIGSWGGLIAGSDEYIGYDSSGQHIAAALGIPTLSIFSRVASPVFQERWGPTGPGIVKTVSETAPGAIPKSVSAVLEEALSLHRHLRTRP